MFATISADIVSSTSLSVDETIRLKQRIEALFALLKTKYPDFYGRQIKGDYIECVMQNVSNALRIALVIKSCIKSFPITEKQEGEELSDIWYQDGYRYWKHAYSGHGTGHLGWRGHLYVGAFT